MAGEVVFMIFMLAVGVGLPIVLTIWALRKFRVATGIVKNGIPAGAVIQSIAETGMTITSPSVGPDAAVYKIGLLVTPPGGGATYQAETTQAVPRIFTPMVLPGAQVGILIDPLSPANVDLDWKRLNAPGAGAGGAGGAGGGTAMIGGVGVDFDASGQPDAGDVSALVGAVRSGAVPSIKGSAAQLLATGTHGTAVITTAQPLGKTVRDINPAADADKLNDPMWLFTLEVSLAGQNPFPAIFGHRVPLAKVALVAPGMRLAVAVDPSSPHDEVAIDWDKSPIGA